MNYLDPTFYDPVFLQFLFLSITNKFDCLSNSDKFSLDHTVKYLAFAKSGFA